MAARGGAPGSVRGHPLVRRSFERALADRWDAHAEEAQRLVDATYRVIARTGDVDPTVRDILAESGLSTQAFYRHFRSKDELLVVLLDDGRRRIVDYLAHRMAKAATPAARIRAWVEGVLAQATDPGAAARTRPFVVHDGRLAELFPDEHRQSAALLVAQLVDPLRDLAADPAGGHPGADGDATRGGGDGADGGDGTPQDQPARDAAAVFQVAFGTMERHVRDRTTPTAADVEHLVAFCLRAVTPGPPAPAGGEPGGDGRRATS